MGQIDFSLVVMTYNMLREAPRTLYSLSRAYQRDIADLNYEVIVVDNGSRQPLPQRVLEELGPEFHYQLAQHPAVSPVPALNAAARQARGRWIGLLIDGARMASPGLLHQAHLASRLGDNGVICTHNWHLGPDVQFRSIAKGYNQNIEDRLLEQIDWRHNGYRLFEISVFAGASQHGWFVAPSESNCLFVSRQTFQRLGGMDERFVSVGGGLASSDYLDRACQTPDAQLLILLGEGTFHQLHGGVTTNVSDEANQRLWQQFDAEYRRLRGHGFVWQARPAVFLGHLPPACAASIRHSCDSLAQLAGKQKQ